MNGNVNMDPKLERASQQFSKNLEKYPIEEQYAVGAISKNVLNGCSWEFVRKTPEIVQLVDAFKKNPNCEIYTTTYSRKSNATGYLIYMNLSYLCSLLGREAPGLLNQSDLMRATEHRKEAILSLAKKMGTGYKGKIGIFCTNDSQTITVDGKPYPAYAISLKELLQVCQRYNYGILVDQQVRTPSQVLQREEYVMSKLVVAPSSNALFIDIYPMR